MKPVQLRLRYEQDDALDAMAKAIMRQGQQLRERERITKNTLIRCAVDIVTGIEGKIEKRNIGSEEELQKRIRKALGA